MKLAIAGALSLALSAPVSPATVSLTTMSGIPADRFPSVVKVECMVGSGSAFRVGPDKLISVNHVTSLQGCFINGKPFTVTEHTGDFSVLKQAGGWSWLKVDCGGFVPGRKYIAIGFARGADTITTVELRGTGDGDDDLSVLRGIFTVIPGQSGGPIVDAETGAVVGTVNVYDSIRGLSGSVALKGTSACQRA